MSVTSPWPHAARQLDTIFKKQMFFHQGFKNDKFWRAFVPEDIDEKGYFGVKSLNIFIVQKAYGWTPAGDGYDFTWPPPGLIDDLNKFIIGVKNFVDYKTLIWVDMWTANELQRQNPESDMPQMMNRTDAAIKAMCDSYPMLQYMGQLTSPVEGNFFEEKIRQFFGNPEFRIP
jgi:hypothetical protein